jgi:hypothetical protein
MWLFEVKSQVPIDKITLFVLSIPINRVGSQSGARIFGMTPLKNLALSAVRITAAETANHPFS